MSFEFENSNNNQVEDDFQKIIEKRGKYIEEVKEYK